LNECWISDRDRFSYEGLNEDRLTVPMIKGEDGLWKEATWSDALQAVAHGLMDVRDASGSAQIGALASEYSTLEELALLGRVTRGLGSENIDFRLRQTDASLDSALTGAPWLGFPVAELDTFDRVLVIGSFLRKDHPLMTQRLRQSAKRGTQISAIDIAGDDPLLKLTARAMPWRTRSLKLRLRSPSSKHKQSLRLCLLFNLMPSPKLLLKVSQAVNGWRFCWVIRL
jgi:NADH-quinone oxidoreductase subunit G